MKMIKTVVAVTAFATILNIRAFAAPPANNSPASPEATVPGDLDLVGGVNQLADAIAELEATGQINHGRAQSLLGKLAKAQRALETPQAGAAVAGALAAHQTGLGGTRKTPKAIGHFLGE